MNNFSVAQMWWLLVWKSYIFYNTEDTTFIFLILKPWRNECTLICITKTVVPCCYWIENLSKDWQMMRVANSKFSDWNLFKLPLWTIIFFSYCQQQQQNQWYGMQELIDGIYCVHLRSSGLMKGRLTPTDWRSYHLLKATTDKTQ